MERAMIATTLILAVAEKPLYLFACKRNALTTDFLN